MDSMEVTVITLENEPESLSRKEPDVLLHYFFGHIPQNWMKMNSFSL